MFFVHTIEIKLIYKHDLSGGKGNFFPFFSNNKRILKAENCIESLSY